MLRRLLVVLSTACVLLVAPAVAGAANITWDGPASGDWATPTSWDTDSVPQAGDTAIIPSGVTVDVTADAEADQVQVLGTLRLVGAVTLDASNPVSANADVVVVLGGSLQQQGSGILASTGDDVVRIDRDGDVSATSGNATVGPNVTDLVYDGSGTTTFTGTFSLPDALDAIDVNDGVLAYGDGQMYANVTPPTVTIGSTATVRHVGSVNLVLSLPFDVAAGGTFDIASSGASSVVSLERGIDFLGAGDITFTGNPGATLEVGGAAITSTIGGNLDVSGQGTLRLRGSGSKFDIGTHAVVLGADVTFRANYDTNTATIDADTGSMIAGNGILTWNGSDPFAAGAVVTTGQGVDVFTSGTTNFNGATFTVNGTWTATGGLIYGAPSFTIAPTGTLRNTSTVSTPLFGAPVHVQGTVQLSDDADLQFSALADFADYSTANGGTISGGTWDLGASSSIILGAFAGVARIDGADVTLRPGAKFAGSGMADQLPGHAISIVNGGVLRLRGGTTGFTTRSFTAGTSFVVTDGTLAVGGDDGLQVNAFGAVGVGADGALRVDDGSRINSSAITSNGELAGGGVFSATTFAINGGVVRPGTDGFANAIGTMVMSGPVQFNGGRLELSVTGTNNVDSDHLSLQGPSTSTFSNGFEIAIDPTGFTNPGYSFLRNIVSLDTVPAGAIDGVAPTLVVSPALTAPKEYRLGFDADSLDLSVGESVAPTGPTTSTASPAASTPTTDNTVTVTFGGASDGVGGSGLDHYLVRWDHVATTVVDAMNGTNTLGTPATVTSPALADGTDWYVHLAAVDVAGNVSTTTHLGPFVIDTTAPAAPGVTGAPTGATSVATASLAITGEAGATFACSVDGAAFAACTSPVALAGLAVGAHSVAVRQADAAGNVSATTTVSWTVVAQDPQPTTPTPPTKPAPSKVVFVGAPPKFATIGRTGTIRWKLPVAEAGVKVVFSLEANKAQATRLGLRLPAGKKTLVIGTGTATSTTPGSVTVTVRLTRAAKQAFAKVGGRGSKVTSASGTVRITLSKGGASSTLSKPVSFRR